MHQKTLKAGPVGPFAPHSRYVLNMMALAVVVFCHHRASFLFSMAVCSHVSLENPRSLFPSGLEIIPETYRCSACLLGWAYGPKTGNFKADHRRTHGKDLHAIPLRVAIQFPSISGHCSHAPSVGSRHGRRYHQQGYRWAREIGTICPFGVLSQFYSIFWPNLGAIHAARPVVVL